MTDVFVFGSNLLGVHGAGAALEARNKWGATPGEGVGRVGDSYAIPTKRSPYARMTLAEIAPHVAVFVDYAKFHPSDTFLLTRVGCGLAGFNWERDIRPLFPEELPPNVRLLDPL